MTCVTWCYLWEDISIPCTRNQQQTKIRILSGSDLVNRWVLLGLLIEADVPWHLHHQMATPERETARGSQEPRAHHITCRQFWRLSSGGQFCWSLLSAELTAHTSWGTAGMLGNLVDGVDFRDFLKLLSCLLPELKGLPCWSESFTCVWRSFPQRWKALSHRKLLSSRTFHDPCKDSER